MDTDDEDIFNYTPLVTSQSQGVRNKSRTSISYTASQQAAPKNKQIKLNKNPKLTPKKKKLSTKKKICYQTEVCPICQFPWFSLGLKGSRIIHAHKCGNVDFSEIPACPKGVQCQETFERHYLLYNHEAWAKLRADPWKHDIDESSELSDQNFQNDSGFIDRSVPGPSGWKPKSDLIDLTSDSVISNSLGKPDSLPDLSQPLKKVKIELDSIVSPDIDFYLEHEEVRDADEETVKYFPKPSQNHSIDDQKTLIYSLDRPHKLELSFREHDSSISAGETIVYNEGLDKRRAADVPVAEANKSITFSSSNECKSFFPNKGHPPSPNFTTVNEDDSRISEPEHQEIEEDEEDYELLNKLVDEAVDKYVGKAISNAKFEHLHIHYHNNSPRKKGSILDYFKPTASNACSEKTNSAGSLSTNITNSSLQSPIKKKSSVEEWKTLMSKMQNNSQKDSNKQSTEQTLPEKQLQQKNYYGGGNRTCPFYKYIPDTSFVVDAFSYGYLNGIEGYFLSHFHYDHYRGLTKKFNKSIYCSQITGNLVNQRIGVPLQYIKILPMDTPQVISSVEVTLLDANHCPGSVMFLFKLTTGTTILHVGDFRAHPKMESYPVLWDCNIDTLYLDTTYCNPSYDFPRQDEIIEKCVNIATSHIGINPKTLIAVGSYTIGKERVFRAIASELDCRIWASGDKQKILRCIEDDEITKRLTSDKFSARVHVIKMNEINPKVLSDYVNSMSPKYNEVVAIRPTGWEHSGNNETSFSPKRFGGVYIYGIPYSEHSSYNELERFVKFSRPKKIVPTVNVGNPTSRKKMEENFSQWLK
ncbi:DNA cross-link repair 1 protein-like [Palaemon carinicauda]|uniref:DNA cross-link repair 1 protein-like n=1 Tax=Palaemon carinicauda TaxID=392227 RepID=UPI0035B66D04